MSNVQEKSCLDAERVRELLDYDPLTGIFRWSEVCRHRRRGKVAGKLEAAGYVRIKVEGRLYAAHRLAWLWMTGDWPEDEIDHRNCIRSDNRWINLRNATRSQNRANSRLDPKTISGFKGVYKQTKGDSWGARIHLNGKAIHLGNFDDPEKASLAYLVAANRIFGEFARSK